MGIYEENFRRRGVIAVFKKYFKKDLNNYKIDFI